MKDIKLKFIFPVVATIFSVALLFPTAVQLAHSFEGHEHPVCTELGTHLHKAQLDCPIFDFHFSNFTFSFQQLPQFLDVDGYQTVSTVYRLPKIIGRNFHYHLRGPPVLS